MANLNSLTHLQNKVLHSNNVAVNIENTELAQKPESSPDTASRRLVVFLKFERPAIRVYAVRTRAGAAVADGTMLPYLK